MVLKRAARYMGCPDPDEKTLALLKKAMLITREAAQPRHVLLRINREDFPLPGGDVERLLQGCREVILMGATLGAPMDERIRRESLMDMALGLAVNACDAALLEEYLNGLSLPLREGEFATPRFSPGYGDLPLETQPMFLSRLKASAIGLYETSAHMLAPEKSVTALCGVTHEKRGQCIRKCDLCPNAACPFREG